MTNSASDRPQGEGSSPYQRLVENVAHAIFMIDTDGTITSWSPPAQTLYGYAPERVLGESLRLLFADDESREASLTDLLGDVTDETVTSHQWHQPATGESFYAEMTLSPLWNGDLHGYGVVVQDTTVAHRHERRLEQQNDRLKEFTDVLVHDLRNPLNVIAGRTQLAQETDDDEHLSVIADTTDRMEDLVEDLLAVARNGDEIVDPEVADLSALVRQAWEPVSVETATLNHEPLCHARVDPHRACQLFENLFRNAIEHGGTDVTVTVGQTTDGFFVADDGPGIPPARRDEVFDHGVSTEPDGTGYGLSIVRTIANAHGWEVSLSETDDGGACFSVTGIEYG